METQRRIMIADDSRMDTMLLKHTIEVLKYPVAINNNIINKIVIKESGFKVQVDSVLSAQEALARLATGDKPDLIFLDINMPVLSGWDFLNEYKKLPEEKKMEALS